MIDPDPDKLKVVELKVELDKRGLDTKGNKAVLVQRLKDHLAAGPQARSEPTEYDPTQPTEDTDPQTEFDNKQFVIAPIKGVSFSLSSRPKPVKPAPPPPRPASPGPELEPSTAAASKRRSGAAAFFLSEVSRLDNTQEQANVPLPPSFGYGLDEDDEEEDGPPGMVPLKLPAIKFDKPFTKETEPKDYVESWKRLEMPDLRSTLRPDSDWVEERVVQEPALFLQEEAARSGVQLLTEVEHTDVPGLSLESVKMRVSYNYLIARAQGKTKKAAMDLCALKILKDSGPWLDLDVVRSAVEGVERLLPTRDWWPPTFNLSHVVLEDKSTSIRSMKKLYELSVRLGGLVCSGVGDTVEEALQYTALHLRSFVKNRDLGRLEPAGGDGLTYTMGRSIVRVALEKGPDKELSW